MRILLLAAALPLFAAAAPPSQPVLMSHACRTSPDATTTREAGRPRKLGELPPGRPWRAVYRLENGCPTPVALPIAKSPR